MYNYSRSADYVRYGPIVAEGVHWKMKHGQGGHYYTVGASCHDMTCLTNDVPCLTLHNVGLTT